jgi:hypothetical protein
MLSAFRNMSVHRFQQLELDKLALEERFGCR